MTSLQDNTNEYSDDSDDDLTSEMEESEESALLFYMVLVIELNELEKKNEPFIAYRLPNLWKTDPFSKNVAQFCFPDTTPFPTTEMENERFSFVLTEDDGDRRFGYCLRKLAQGTGLRMPICFVVLTYIPCEPLYNKILDRIAFHYESSSSKMLTQFLESVVQNDFPQPGQTFSVEIHDDSSGSDTWKLTRPEIDLALEQLPVDRILISLSSINILRIFTSLLVERRIIFCSKKISTLSNIAQVMMALIYPFVWQHIFIPILPESLLSYCCAPMPFVVGVLESHIDQVLKMPMDEVLIVMIDDDQFTRTPESDIDADVNLIPQKYFNELLKNLKLARKLAKRANGKKSRVKLQRPVTHQELQNSIQSVQNSFLQFFVELLGPAYRLGKSYSVDKFKQVSSSEMKPLLELFVCSQLYERFIRLHLLSDNFKNSLFEREIRLWLRKNNSESSGSSGSRIKLNYPTSCVSSADPLGRKIQSNFPGQKAPAQSLASRASRIYFPPSSNENSPSRQSSIPLKNLPVAPTRSGRSNTTIDYPSSVNNRFSRSPTAPVINQQKNQDPEPSIHNHHSSSDVPVYNFMFPSEPAPKAPSTSSRPISMMIQPDSNYLTSTSPKAPSLFGNFPTSTPPKPPTSSGPPSITPPKPNSSGPPSITPPKPSSQVVNSLPPLTKPPTTPSSGPPSITPPKPNSSGPPSIAPPKPSSINSPTNPIMLRKDPKEIKPPTEDAPQLPHRDEDWMASLSKRTQKKRKKTISADQFEGNNFENQ